MLAWAPAVPVAGALVAGLPNPPKEAPAAGAVVVELVVEVVAGFAPNKLFDVVEAGAAAAGVVEDDVAFPNEKPPAAGVGGLLVSVVDLSLLSPNLMPPKEGAAAGAEVDGVAEPLAAGVPKENPPETGAVDPDAGCDVLVEVVGFAGFGAPKEKPPEAGAAGAAVVVVLVPVAAGLPKEKPPEAGAAAGVADEAGVEAVVG